jgi:hypothetical protein
MKEVNSFSSYKLHLASAGKFGTYCAIMYFYPSAQSWGSIDARFSKAKDNSRLVTHPAG